MGPTKLTPTRHRIRRDHRGHQPRHRRDQMPQELLRPLRHQEAGLPVGRWPRRDPSRHGVPSQPGGAHGHPHGDRRGRLGRDRVWGVLSALCHVPGGGPRPRDYEEGAKDAFRIYDKNGEGFITSEVLRGLIAELLAPLTDEELDGIIEELDEDGSGTMDFDEFCEMMMSKPE